MSDPVEVAAEALFSPGLMSQRARARAGQVHRRFAHSALEALYADGWRIVRVADAGPGDNGGIAMLVDEEWTPPAAGVAAPEGGDDGGAP